MTCSEFFCRLFCRAEGPKRHLASLAGFSFGLPLFARLGLFVLVGLVGCQESAEVLLQAPLVSPTAWFDSHWQFELPLAGNETLMAAAQGSDGHAWVVGTGGRVLHFDGQHWSTDPTPVTLTLLSVACGREISEPVFAVGQEGVALCRERGVWSREPTGSTAVLREVATGSGGTAWAVGDGGTVLRRTGRKWQEVGFSSQEDLHHVVPFGDGAVVASRSGRLLTLHGYTWEELAPGRFAKTGIKDLTVTPSGELMLLADVVYRYRPAGWEVFWTHGLWNAGQIAFEGGDLFVASQVENVRIYGNLESSRLGINGGYWWVGGLVTGLAVAPGRSPLAVTLAGEITWWEEGTRRDTAGRLGTMAGFSLRDGSFLVQGDQTLLSRQGTQWRPFALTDFTTTIRSLCLDGLSPEDFFATDRRQWIAHWQDGVWTELEWEEMPDIVSLVVLADGTPVVGDGERIYGWDGSRWRFEPGVGGEDQVWRLYRTGAGEVIAIGEESLHRHDGSGWALEAPLSGVVYGLIFRCAGSLDSLFLLFGSETYYVYSRQEGTFEYAGEYGYFQEHLLRPRSWAESGSGVWIGTGYPGYVYRLEGHPLENRWTQVAGPVGDTIDYLGVEPDGTVFAVTRRRPAVLRYPPRTAP